MTDRAERGLFFVRRQFTDVIIEVTYDERKFFMEKKIKWQDKATKEWHTSNIVPKEADPDTVCLYSGTNDIEDTPIYEGDILRNDNDDNPKLWTVELKDGAFYATSTGFANNDATISLPKKIVVNHLNTRAMKMKIVGNIFSK